MRLSVVTTLYKSAGSVAEFCRRALAAAEAVADEVEIVLVDDGSPDNSLQLAVELAKADPRLKVVELSRNFGHHKALMTGLQHARGDLIFLIDSDLEEDPALLVQFHATMLEKDADVVFGQQAERKGGFTERMMGAVAFRLFDLFIPWKIPRNHITVRLMRRDYVDALLLHREQATVIGGLWVITGFRQHGVEVGKLWQRKSSYSFGRRWIMLIDSITSFSERPLVAIFYLGLFISAGSVAVSIWLLLQRMFFSTLLEGWVSVMLSVWFLGGLLIFCVGLIGIYVSKIFLETKGRPYTIVRRIHGSGLGEGDEDGR